MANIFDPAIPQSNPATPLLPSQYQDPLNLANQRQMIAQFLTMQALQPHLPQQNGAMAARISPLAGIASMITPLLGAQAMQSAGAEASAIRQRYAADTQKGLGGMLSTAQGQPGILDTNPAGPPTAEGEGPWSVGTLPGTGVSPDPLSAINTGMTSMNPMMQSLATSLQAQQIKKQEDLAGAYASGNNIDSQLRVLNPSVTPNALPPGPASIPPVTKFVDVPDSAGTQKVAQVIETNPNTGAQTVTRGGTVVGENLPQAAAKTGILSQSETLNAAQQSAILGQKIQGQIADAVRSLQESALSGGGADIKQQASKLLQAFGVSLPTTASTDELKNALSGLLTDYGKIFGSRVTNLDLSNVKQYVGTIDTDPTAMPKILAGLSAAGIKSMQDYGAMLEARQGQPTVEGFNPDLLTSQQLRNAPMGLSGPQNMQMLTLQALHNYGGDISKYVVPGSITRDHPAGETFSPNSTFNIRPIPITTQTPDAGQPTPEAPVPVVRTNADYGKLPSGSLYIAPDGSTKRKK